MQAFAEIEARINLATIAKLANADADFGAGLVVAGIFNALPIVSYDVQSTNPRFECLAAAIPLVATGTPVTIRTVAYTVQNLEPNGAGMVALDLTRA